MYRYSPSRSGETAKQVLADSEGRLVVDQFTGYNAVTKPGKRTRAGCLAHARRKLYEQREHPEVAEAALNLIGAIYGSSSATRNFAVSSEPKNTSSFAACALVHSSRDCFVGRADIAGLSSRDLGWAARLGTSSENHAELGCFLRFASIPPDNNVAEAALRRVALGRKNFLFVGHEDAGHDLAVLYTLVATCEKHGVNAIDYVTDVLTRVRSHPARDVVDLLPHRWKPLVAAP